jgi:hypothetical protein
MAEWNLEEYSRDDKENGDAKFYRFRGGFPLSTKLKFWGLIVLGAAIGTALFLFFLTVFIYIFLPVAAFLILFALIRRLLSR